MPKNASPACLNDYRPVALTSLVMKCFERLIKHYICASLPRTMDPLQFAYRSNRSTDDAVSQVLHTTLSHLDSQKGGYVRLLFIDYSSAFNTIVPTRLSDKLIELGLNTPLCAWILDFLTARPQVVRVGRHTSNPLFLNTGSPRVASSAQYCTPCTHMITWPGPAPTPSLSLRMTQWWWA